MENLLPDHFVTDASCSWTQLAFLTKDGECLLRSNYTNGTSKPVEVENNGTKFKAVGCRESSCILVTGGCLDICFVFYKITYEVFRNKPATTGFPPAT